MKSSKNRDTGSMSDKATKEDFKVEESKSTLKIML